MALSVINNNPGNIRDPKGAFLSFDTPEQGMQALRNDLLIKVGGRSKAMAGKYGRGYKPTLANVISTWAPPTENDTQGYISFVAKQAGIEPNAVLTEKDVERILPAMVQMEGGSKASSHFGVGKQYADAGNIMTDAQVDGGGDISQLSDEELDRMLGAAPGGAQADISKLSDADLDKMLAEQPEPKPQTMVAPNSGNTKPSFIDGMVANADAGIKAVGDLLGDTKAALTGGEMSQAPTPAAEALRALRASGKFDWSNRESWNALEKAFVEGAMNSPGGKLLTAVGGLSPVGNVISTGMQQHGMPAIEEYTGLRPEEVEAASLLAGPLMVRGGQKAGLRDPAADAVPNAINSAKTNVQNIRSGIGARNADELNASAAKIIDNAGGAANAMRGGDVTLTPQASQNLINQVRSMFALPENEIFPDSHPVTAEIFNQLTNAQGPLRLNVLNNMRERLTNEGKGSDAAMAGKLRTNMMNTLEQIGQKDIASGDPAALQHLGEFLNQWKQGKRFEDVAELIKSAQLSPNEANALQRNFGRFLSDDNNLRNFTPEEIALMQKVAEKGWGDNLLKLVGSVGLGPNNKLIPVLTGMAMYGGGLGAIPTAIASTVAAAARGARNTAVAGRAENVLKAIEGRDTSAPYPAAPPPAGPISGQVIPPAGPPGPPLLTGPQSNLLGVRQPTEIIVDSAGNARPQNITEVYPMEAARANAQNMGSTADIVKAYMMRQAGEKAAAEQAPRNAAWDALQAEAMATKGQQMNQMFEQNTPSITDIISEGLQSNRDRAAAVGGPASLGPIGQAMLDALKQSQQKKPLKITISNDPNIGPDGLPRVNLPVIGGE